MNAVFEEAATWDLFPTSAIQETANVEYKITRLERHGCIPHLFVEEKVRVLHFVIIFGGPAFEMNVSPGTLEIHLML